MRTNKEDVKVWLSDPCTKLFMEWLKKDRETHFKAAANSCYNISHINAKSEYASDLFGKCKGLDRVLSLLNECIEQARIEDQQLSLELQDRIETKEEEDNIKAFIDFAQGGSDE